MKNNNIISLLFILNVKIYRYAIDYIINGEWRLLKLCIFKGA